VVAISRNAGSYALIASASLKPNADALRKLAQAAGNSVSTTQTTLQTQTQDLTRFVQRVSPEADPAAALETARGLSRSTDISRSIEDALKAVQQRFGYTQAREQSRPSALGGSSQGAALVALLRGSIQNDDGFDFSALLSRTSTAKVKPSQIRVSAGNQDQPDVYERGIPLTTSVGGAATTTVTKTALRAETVNVLLDKSNPDLGGISAVAYVPDGSPRSDNEGFYVKTVAGSGDDTIVLDTRDPTNDDTRLSAIDVSTGEGSDVVFIAGNNISRVDAGAGDDFVAVEGDGIVDGGDGNDLIYARTASGDAGDDVIFTDGFASGGEGNDNITIFSLDSENDDITKLAFGGAGNDEIVASVSANIDGGEGNDVLILREGGSAGGGDGDDKISAWATATVEGGAGNDDIFLLNGGRVDAGAGDDIVSVGNYATVSGGQGDDTIDLKGGGVFTFSKGDGKDTVNLEKARFDTDAPNKALLNRVVVEGYDYAELTVTVGALDLKIKPIATNLQSDNLQVNREIVGKMEVVFRKNGFEQVLKIDGLTQTLGARTAITP
jgi:Ca2+-binding RTX toxin-like protein